MKWLLEFLSDRHQEVDVNGARSTSADVTSGVIQGSVVGLVLFVLYINDLPSACPGCTIELFADDAKLYKVIRSIHDRVVLQSSLTALCAYARQWRLTLSHDKCLYLQLGYSDMSITYTFDDHILRPCNLAKDLGVTVQSNLQSGQHCTEIANKANTRAKLILKAFSSRDPDIYAQAFVTYVRPLLEYCSPAWSPHFKCDIDVVEKLQRSFTRKVYYMCDLSPASYNERLERLGHTRLELRRIHADLILIFKISHSLIHSNLLHALHFANQRQGMATRGHRYKLMTESTNKLVLHSFFINRVTSMWNFLPSDCFYPDNLQCFKRKICNIDFSRFLHRQF